MRLFHVMLMSATLALAACASQRRAESVSIGAAAVHEHTEECQHPAEVEFGPSTATRRLLATQHVADLRQQIPNRRIVCRVDGVSEHAIDLYLGDWGADTDFRIGFYRVTCDGRVWMNSDRAGLEDRFVEIE